jgi:hypothetical protein
MDLLAADKSGLTTARLATIVRQKDAAYRGVVEQLARGNVREAIADLDARGFVVDPEPIEPHARRSGRFLHKAGRHAGGRASKRCSQTSE